MAEESKGSWVGGLGNLGILRQVGLMVGLAASVAVGFGVVLWSQEPDYRVLFSNVDFADSNTIIEQLQGKNIAYKFDATGKTIMVPNDSLHTARLALAADGFTVDKNAGFEMLNGDQPLGSSQFMETARYRHALEGELAKTITSMNSIRNARVHLAIPKESTFVRDNTKPRASVFLDIVSGRSLDKNQVSAIANLVAFSIPSLSLEDVSVVDQQGRLLNTKEFDTEVELAAKQLEYTKKIEDKLLNRVNSIVSPLVGVSNFRAEISADIDFTQTEQADEQYASEPSVLRSEQILNESNNTSTVGGVPGALSNTPPAASDAPETIANANTGTGEQAGSKREQAVRNYEVDRTVSYTKHQTGSIKRLSVAVVLNNITVVDADGKETAKTWEDADIQRIETLVKNAVGFSDERGDSVTVINSDFFNEEVVQAEDIPMWEQAWFWNIIKQVFAGLLVVVLVFGVLRPILKSLAVQEQKKKESEAGGIPGINLDELGSGKSPYTFEEQIEIVRAMIAEDPAKVAQSVRQWVKTDD